jgi:hypothetical protein
MLTVLTPCAARSLASFNTASSASSSLLKRVGATISAPLTLVGNFWKKCKKYLTKNGIYGTLLLATSSEKHVRPVAGGLLSLVLF